jgi:hypothetical protein
MGMEPWAQGPRACHSPFWWGGSHISNSRHDAKHRRVWLSVEGDAAQKRDPTTNMILRHSAKGNANAH